MTTTTIKKVEEQVAFDRAGSRPDGLGGRKMYRFWSVSQFAELENLSERQVRFLIAECFCPHHGTAHKGVEGGGLRLCESARQWLNELYRPLTARGRRWRLGRNWNESSFNAQDIYYVWEDERMAYGIVYHGKFVPDAFTLEEESWEELESWKKFRTVKR